MAFGVPLDPTSPREPVVIARRRPQSVALAGVLLYVSGALGLVSAIALLLAAGGIVDDFRRAAVAVGVDGTDAAKVATGMRSALLSSGLGALVLAVLSVLLGRGVRRRNEASRVGALVVAAGSLGCAMVRTSVTAFSRHVNWSVAAGHADAMLTNQVAQAVGDAMPSWLVGLGGGLTDLQALGYIAVAILLLAPASMEYFRTRAAAASPPPDQ
jgi:hypothetical protein